MLGGLFGAIERSEKTKERVRYQKIYPFNTSKDGDTRNDVIFVLDVDHGYCVFEMGHKTDMIKWHNELDEAVEFAVDHARERILNHQG